MPMTSKLFRLAARSGRRVEVVAHCQCKHGSSRALAECRLDAGGTHGSHETSKTGAQGPSSELAKCDLGLSRLLLPGQLVLLIRELLIGTILGRIGACGGLEASLYGIGSEGYDGADVDGGSAGPEMDGQHAGGGMPETLAADWPQRGDGRDGHGGQAGGWG